MRFPLSDFQKIMEFGRLNIQQLKESTDSLLGKKVHIPLESGGFKGIVLFDQCEVNKDIHGRWYVGLSSKMCKFFIEFCKTAINTGCVWS